MRLSHFPPLTVSVSSRPKGSEAASKCHAPSKTLSYQAIQLKNLKNCNLPVNDDWAAYKIHNRIKVSRSFN